MKTFVYKVGDDPVLAGLSFVSSVWAQGSNALEFKATSSFVAGETRSFRRGPIRSVRNPRIRWSGRFPVTPRDTAHFCCMGPGKFHSV